MRSRIVLVLLVVGILASIVVQLAAAEPTILASLVNPDETPFIEIYKDSHGVLKATIYDSDGPETYILDPEAEVYVDLVNEADERIVAFVPVASGGVELVDQEGNALPDGAIVDVDGSILQPPVSSSPMGYARDGDEVTIVNSTGEEVEAVIHTDLCGVIRARWG